jgi:mannosyltransferase OCH1-like enzyme
VYSQALRAVAHHSQADPRHCFDLLRIAVQEGAVRLVDRSNLEDGARHWAANVPPQIVQYWHAEHPPPDVQRAIVKVREHNPGMACTLFHEPAAREFVGAHFGAGVRALFDLCFHHTMKSDLFRLCYLYVHGGIYVDVDIDCHAPFQTMLANQSYRCFLFYAEGQPWCIENGFIAAEPADRLIFAMLTRLEHNLVQYRDRQRFRGIWAETGPGAATEAIMGLLAQHFARSDGNSLIDDLLLSRNDLCAVSYFHDELQYKTTAEGNWRKAARPAVR